MIKLEESLTVVISKSFLLRSGFSMEKRMIKLGERLTIVLRKDHSANAQENSCGRARTLFFA